MTTVAATLYGKWNRDTLREAAEVSLTPQPVLKNLGERPGGAIDWGLRWDPNHINWSEFDTADDQIRPAFGVLIRAIDLCAAAATPVILRRGDALITDNLRCLVARREFDPALIAAPKRGFYPQYWWLRGYYGFRRSQYDNDAGQGA